MNDSGSAPSGDAAKIWISALSAVLVLALIFGLVLIPGGSNEQDDSSAVDEGQSVSLDSDGDGILDDVETAGWTVASGATYATDPKLADTDADGLSDSEEAGAEISEGQYQGVSNPLKADSDDDGLDDKTELAGGVTLDNRQFTLDPLKADTDDDQLSDLDELDNGTHPNFADTDGDGLNDVYEINNIGTDPLSTDTDEDGFNDAFEDKNRESRELDPQFADVVVSKEEWATDVAQGAIFGDWMEKDTVPFFIGVLSLGALAFIPIVGTGASTLGDLRDALAALIKQDYVALGISLLALIPMGGDAVSLGKKVDKFIARAPHLAPQVAGVIARAPQFSEETRIFLQKKVWGQTWETLHSKGVTDKALNKLVASGRTDLKVIEDAIGRKGHVEGRLVAPMKDGYEGEKWLEKDLEKSNISVSTQVVFKTDGCVQVCNPSYRRIDSLADGIAHESKVGYTSLTSSIKKQIESDAYLIKTGQIKDAQWHFFPSGTAQSTRLGPTKQLLDYLDQYGIKYTPHLPNE